jgi:hypothetical protein
MLLARYLFAIVGSIGFIILGILMGSNPNAGGSKLFMLLFSSGFIAAAIHSWRRW